MDCRAVQLVVFLVLAYNCFGKSTKECLCQEETCKRRNYESCVRGFLNEEGSCDVSCRRPGHCPNANCSCSDAECRLLGFDECAGTYCQDGECKPSCCQKQECECDHDYCISQGYTMCTKAYMKDGKCKPVCRGPTCPNKNCTCDDKECQRQGFERCAGTYCENGECMISCCDKHSRHITKYFNNNTQHHSNHNYNQKTRL
uniref:Perlwapin-like n=2 Tax=Bursaphelenchus xylophilus TaxID=6326 RepID=A0A1I7SHJ0_BURXY